MKEYRVGNTIVRIHGEAPSREALEKACLQFVRAIEKERKEGDTKCHV